MKAAGTPHTNPAAEATMATGTDPTRRTLRHKLGGIQEAIIDWLETEHRTRDADEREMARREVDRLELEYDRLAQQYRGLAR